MGGNKSMRLRLKQFLHLIHFVKLLYFRLKAKFIQFDDPMIISPKSEFAQQIRQIISKVRPTRLIETGSYLGIGSTFIIAQTLRDLGMDDALFFTIEVNPTFYKQLLINLKRLGLRSYVIPLNGLSIPRKLLPSLEEIRCLIESVPDGIFIDYPDLQNDQKAIFYYNETNFDEVPDDLLGATLKIFNYCPQFVLLDSAGHIGNIEFNYLLEQLKGECYIALDDIYHIKHYKSFLQIQNDPRCEIIVHSKEKYGFAIIKFNPI
jgi:hypothetical protein